MRWDFWRVWGQRLRCCYYCDIPRQSHGSEWWTWCGSNTRPSHYESDADYLAELQVLVEGFLPTDISFDVFKFHCFALFRDNHMDRNGHGGNRTHDLHLIRAMRTAD